MRTNLREGQKPRDPFPSQTFDTIDLQRLQFVVSKSVSDDFVVHEPELGRFHDEMCRSIQYTLRGHVWAEAPKSISVRYPSTWWDAFKARWFPEWALEAYPVNYTIETMEGQIFYPKLPLTVPEHAHNLRMVVRKES